MLFYSDMILPHTVYFVLKRSDDDNSYFKDNIFASVLGSIFLLLSSVSFFSFTSVRVIGGILCLLNIKTETL